MGRRVLRRHIWGYSVCLCPIKRTSGLNELNQQFNSYYWHMPLLLVNLTVIIGYISFHYRSTMDVELYFYCTVICKMKGKKKHKKKNRLQCSKLRKMFVEGSLICQSKIYKQNILLLLLCIITHTDTHYDLGQYKPSRHMTSK